METESGAAAIVPPEQELTEALLALSWPLPRTVEDADSALTRLEGVKAVLTRLEQQSVGTDAWWAGQVDGLATQSGFVLEWWRPVLRDPDLDWTLNHQAHLTADLATLASAGARLLDQIEPSADAEAAAVHARRVEQEKRWGPAAVPPFPPSGPKPRPPQQVFGEAAEVERGEREDLNAPEFPPISPPQRQPHRQENPQPAYDAPSVAAPAASVPVQNPPSIPVQKAPESATGSEAHSGLPRHRRPVYEFDDAGHAPSPPPAYPPPPAGPAPRSPLVPGPGFGGPPQGRTLAPAGFQPPAQAPTQSRMHSAPAVGAFGFVGEDDDDDEPDSLVPSGLALRRHQRRLLIQTGAILGAVGVLCWIAVNALSGSPSHTSAAGDATHTTKKTTPSANGGTAADGLTNQNPTSTPSKSTGTSPTPSAAPSTVHSSAPDATTVSSVRVTLLGGSNTVPQIVALITVETAGNGQVTVTGSYYGASGSKKVAAESEKWILSGKTSYQYSVPIANSAYCGTTFHFTVSAGGHSASGETSPGC